MPDRTLHILIIDDNEDILMMLGTMLKMKGYQVTKKDSAHDLVDFLSVTKPDIIMMDMLLSGSDGREVCKELKSHHDLAAIPLIMISAHPSARRECQEAGADHFLEKPFEMKDVFEAIENMAGRIRN
jgi:CheY-like chemotaxis protein